MKTEKYNQEVRAMKFRHIKDIDGFFEAVGSCKGRVELVTDEGDRLNLKSKLTQYLAMAKVFTHGNEIPEMDVVASEKEDMERLLEFVMMG